MKFEYDPVKSESNKVKHGIDFEQAQALWRDVDRLNIPAAYKDEERFALIGRIDSRHWTAAFTYRGDAYRIMSVRPAREEALELDDEE
ncbi:MAG: BrnT family toxin [Deltaproteobacteria bacterium]|jgi:uncharacterized DUF497 family protein|nr:BrnT family toxin [Deltaproteobacteria bacterium]